MQTNDQINTNIGQAIFEKGLLYLFSTPKPSSVVQCRLAANTRNVGIIYCIPVPAYDPVNFISTLMSSKKYGSSNGGTIAPIGNNNLLNMTLYDSKRLVSKNKPCKLFLSVIAIIGKLVDRVNTGNRARKYSITSKKIFSLSVGTKFKVYKSLRCANANAPVNARRR